ncbi:uncharacterized protein LOC122312579 [Carya illinoinensis]|uniref:uncharacterized protein LOC122312579 n=1 Tax=Carya illinoinensis TaxID=32201 RepID=UPI001C722C81|nr:uncharacterized protein LOC122312579 [Carya illinoinensis]
MAIKVFYHEHALWLDQKKSDDNAECDACSSICIGLTYSCRECSLFHLHESCSKLPKELHTLFHPHPLRLTLQVGYKQRCFACAVLPSRCFFRCNECNFILDAKCAFIKPATEQMEEQFRTHFGHEHPLLLLENIPNDRVVCLLCREYCSDLTYGCLPCRFFLHRSCFERTLPMEIRHFSHPCPLTLYTYAHRMIREAWNTPCRACRKSLPRGSFLYGCSKCKYVMDIDCTWFPTTEYASNRQHEICHFIRGHPLSLSSIEKGRQVNCCICGKHCNGTMAVAELAAVRIFTSTNHALMSCRRRSSTIPVTLATLST